MKLVEKIVITIIIVLLVLAIIPVGVKHFGKYFADNIQPNITSRTIPFKADISKANTILANSYGEGNKFARNPWGMEKFDGKVYIGAGDYDKNSGATPIICYDAKTSSFSKCDTLHSEQISRFFVKDNCLYTTEIDPVNWGYGTFYKKTKNDENEWFTPFEALPSNIHCYDMEDFDDKLFFCGSVESYSNYSMIQYVEKSDMPVDDFSKTKQIYLYKDGEKIYESSACYRVYELIVFEDNLYAWHRGAVYDGEYTGLYVYNKDKCRFDFVEGEKTISPVILKRDNNYCYDMIQEEVVFNNNYVFINNGILKTQDLKNYKECSLGEDFEEYVARDALVIENQLYILASKAQIDGKFKTGVFVTEDLEKFSQVLYFETDSYMISFECIDNTFIFGEGGTEKDTADSCGNLYTYKID